MSNPDDVGRAFVPHYYQTFQSNVNGLTPLFTEASMMTWEGERLQGAQAIVAKLTPFSLNGSNAIRLEVTTVDVQPSVTPSALLIFVTGAAVLDASNPGNKIHFSQMFQLVSSGPNQYSVHNTIFRLNYGI